MKILHAKYQQLESLSFLHLHVRKAHSREPFISLTSHL